MSAPEDHELFRLLLERFAGSEGLRTTLAAAGVFTDVYLAELRDLRASMQGLLSELDQELVR